MEQVRMASQILHSRRGVVWTSGCWITGRNEMDDGYRKPDILKSCLDHITKRPPLGTPLLGVAFSSPLWRQEGVLKRLWIAGRGAGS